MSIAIALFFSRSISIPYTGGALNPTIALGLQMNRAM